MLNKLVPNEPVGVRLSINQGPASPLAGGDFMSICVIGGRHGANASLLLAGIDAVGDGVDAPCRVESAALYDGDVVVLNVLPAKDVGGGDDVSGRLLESIARKVNHPYGKETNNPFNGWNFLIEHDESKYCATSEPFNHLQVDIVWRPGDAYISFKVMSMSVLPDGSTEGRRWDEGKLTSGQSLKIRVEGVT